jgi:hypothetical protein
MKYTEWIDFGKPELTPFYTKFRVVLSLNAQGDNDQTQAQIDELMMRLNNKLRIADQYMLSHHKAFPIEPEKVLVMGLMDGNEVFFTDHRHLYIKETDGDADVAISGWQWHETELAEWSDAV